MQTALLMCLLRVSRRVSFVTTCCALLICVAIGRTEEQPPTEPATPSTLVLDPDSAAELAIQNSLQLRVDAQSVAEAEAKLQQALAVDNLQLSLSASLLRRGPAPQLPQGFESFFIKTIHTEALTASKLLWSWGKTRALREVARVGVEAAQFQADVTKLALAKMAREAVLGLAYDERMVDVDYQTLKSLMEHQRVTQKLYREGVVAFFEMAQADAQVAAVERLVAERRATVERDRVRLRRILGVSQATPIEVSVGRLPEQPDMSLQEAIDYALEHRPEMQQARTMVRLQEASIRLARQSLNPTVSVSAQVQDQTASFVTRPLTYQIILAFEKPLYDGGSNKAEVKEAVAKAEAARRQLEQLAEAVAAEVANQYLQIEHLKRRISTGEVEMRAAFEQLRIARLRYQEGLGLGVEVIDAQAAVTRAQTGRANAELELQLAIVRLRSAMGMADLQEGAEQ